MELINTEYGIQIMWEYPNGIVNDGFIDSNPVSYICRSEYCGLSLRSIMALGTCRIGGSEI